jgi:membrane-associated phospholipid phosphatase
MLSRAHIDSVVSHIARRHPAGKAARAVAKLGSPSIVAAEGLAAAIALHDGRSSLAVALASPVAIGIGKLLKRLVPRPRPGLHRFGHEGLGSFPSTHVAGPVALLVCLACVAPPDRRWRLALALGALAGGAVGRIGRRPALAEEGARS